MITKNKREGLRAAPMLVAAALACVAGFSAAAQSENTATAKGIFLSEKEDRPTGVRFNVLLERGDSRRTVESAHRFINGDRMKFQFETNRDAYIYVVHRTFDGDPESSDTKRVAGSKGIEVVRREDRGRAKEATYQLLFPSSQAGQNNKLAARKVHTVPTSSSVYFNMDDKPGIEKLYLVVSPTPIDIKSYFDIESGKIRGRDDTADDVISRLNADLSQYGKNVELTFSKGIQVGEADSYGIVVDREKPMMLEVDLAHHRR